MPIIVDCQNCGRKLRVPDELLGRAVQCPTCGLEFEARADLAAPRIDISTPPGAPPLAPPLPLLEEEPAEDTQPCRGCGRQVPRAAPRCPYCGDDLAGGGRRSWEEPDDDRPWDQPGMRRDSEPERGALILTLGILSVFLPLLGPVLGIVAVVMALGDLRKMRQGQMDPRGQNTTQAGMVCGIIGAVVQGVVSLCCGFCLLGTIMPATAPVPVPGPPPPAAPPPAAPPVSDMRASLPSVWANLRPAPVVSIARPFATGYNARGYLQRPSCASSGMKLASPGVSHRAGAYSS